MICGVSCAALATLAQSKSKAAEPEHHYRLGLGVAIEIMSIFAGALNMVLANELGKRLNLGSMDMTFYMSLPAALFLLVPSIFLSSPSWPGEGLMTDCEVFSLVYQLAPSVLALACLLGVFACAYNVLQIDMAQSLSATYTTFAGNFNKAMTVMISITMGLERLPEGIWGFVMLLATLGNIGSFTWYSYLQLK